MPYRHHCVYAKLLQREGSGDVFRPQVGGKTRHPVDESLDRNPLVAVLWEGLGVHHVDDGLHALDTLVQVLLLFEVVEGHRGIVVGVRVLQLQMAPRSRAVDLFEDDSASDC